MKKILLTSALLSLVACSTANNKRQIASMEKDLTGTYLCVADYGKGHKGMDRPACRIYFHPIEGKAGSYNVVFLEYVNLLKMAPSYIASNKLPFIAKRTGYLKNITSKIMAYEANPSGKSGTWELRPLVVQGEQIVAKADAVPRILTINAGTKAEHALAGATMTAGLESDPKEVWFPTDNDERKHGFQYGMAKTAYEKAKLESTWRKEFLKGPYLSQYYNRKDIVLKLRGENQAEFVLNPKYVKMSEKKRRNMFTHPDSAFLNGHFVATEPRDGMFVFQPSETDELSAGIVKGKIALFIDIFDATVSLGQDVVELAFIDSENPENFLMYYEDPKNGEGTDPNAPL